MRLIAGIVVVWLLMGGVGSSRDIQADVESWLAHAFNASGVPGMVAVATRKDDVTVAMTFGRDGRGRPMSAETPLRVASLTKTITAVAVHQLVEQGRLRLDDPVVRHLPAFQMADTRYTQITVQHLLDNRSGIRDGRLDLATLNKAASLEDYVAGLRASVLATDPGATRAYCNANWEVLARMVEVVAGTSYDRYLHAAVFVPLGMTHSTVDIATVDAPGGYQEVFGFHVRRRDALLFSAGSGSNGLVTTAEDLLRWTRWLATGEGNILRAETRDGLLSRALREGNTDGFELSGHRLGKSGMQMTEMSQVLVDPSRGTGAAVLVNTSDMHGTPLTVASALLDQLEGQPSRPFGRTALWTNLAYALSVVLFVWLGVRRVRRARLWAARVRRGAAGRIRTIVRLVWLPLLVVPVVLLPQVVEGLTLGTRTISWTQISYLLLTPAIVLMTMAVVGLAVLVARLRQLQWRQVSGGEPNA